MSARRRRVGSESESRVPNAPGEIPKIEVASRSATATATINSVESRNPEEMTCRDRTVEFKSAVQSMRGRQLNGVVAGQMTSRKSKELQQCSEFMRIAKLIGKDISSTYTKLEKLTLLAKRKSLFDDKPVEIHELTYIIKQDIGNLNKQIAQLQELVKSRGQQNGKHVQSHSNSVVVSLQSRLASMSNDFKKVLEVRTENLKLQKNRREQFSQGPVSSTLPPSAMSGYHQGSVLLADEKASQRGDLAIDMDGGENNRHQQQQMMLADEQDTYLQSRADTMQNIESTIVELGVIFHQLAYMVKEQEEMIQRIDANVGETELNVEGAHSEILKYFQSVTSNRWLMIKVFAVLIFFFIIFVVFMA